MKRWRELVTDRKKMEGYCSTGQSAQRAVVPMEEEEDSVSLLLLKTGLICSYTSLLFGIKQLYRFLFVRIIQGVPLATEPGISLIILTPMKILQRNLNRGTFVV
jgi:hypothetical protein